MGKRIFVAELKRKYPHPVRAIGGRYCDYCVGGALCKEVGLDFDFPSETQLKDAVVKANPKIDWHAISDRDSDNIYALVKGVIKANDEGAFETSWRLLGKLLRWTP
jgi:hypothetical protein